jgi:hypothetical protein
VYDTQLCIVASLALRIKRNAKFTKEYLQSFAGQKSICRNRHACSANFFTSRNQTDGSVTRATSTITHTSVNKFGSKVAACPGFTDYI